jgi:UDP-N-acetylmuramoylalanine--D-glutamate ligase
MQQKKARGEFVVILGMGVSGVAAAKLLGRHGYRVLVSEIEPASKVTANIQELKKHNIPFECEGHSISHIQKASFIVKSPGIPSSIEPLEYAQQNNISVFSEIEVASWFCHAPIIGVTGTNGKTTTTSLIGQMVRKEFPGTMVGGNIGTPFSDFSDHLRPSDYAVIEISSFQLEDIQKFRPKIAAILNITPNHLDHHLAFKEYLKTKMRITENQTEQDYIVYNADDHTITESISKSKSIKIPFSLNLKFPRVQVYIQNGAVYCQNHNTIIKIVELEHVQLKGQHNAANIVAAVSVVHILNISMATIKKVLLQFKPLEHRIEYVAEINNVKFYNDSKATSTMATKCALQSFSKPVILLAGGRAKETDYTVILKDIEQKTKAVCLFGECRQKLAHDLKPIETIKEFPDLNSAFNCAVGIAQPDDVILLSPMCASLDQYKSFEERGKHFKQLVADYQERMNNAKQ